MSNVTSELFVVSVLPPMFKRPLLGVGVPLLMVVVVLLENLLLEQEMPPFWRFGGGLVIFERRELK